MTDQEHHPESGAASGAGKSARPDAGLEGTQADGLSNLAGRRHKGAAATKPQAEMTPAPKTNFGDDAPATSGTPAASGAAAASGAPAASGTSAASGAPAASGTPTATATPPGSTDANAAAATRAQQPAAAEKTGAATTTATDDVWSAALKEQAAAAKPAPTSAPTPPVRQVQFKNIESTPEEHGEIVDFVREIPVEISVELGHTTISIQDLLELRQNSVVKLDGLAGEPLNMYINGFLIASGEVVVVDDRNYGLRVTDISTPTDRLTRLGGRHLN